MSEFNLVPDSDVKIMADSWEFLESDELPYKEIRLTPVIGQAKVNGFINNGVSCYMNVIFQLICNMPGLKEYFLASIHLKEFSERPYEPAGDTFINRIGELVQIYHSYNDHVLYPFRLSEEIEKNSKTFSSKKTQQDAHEFLTYILDRLSTALDR